MQALGDVWLKNATKFIDGTFPNWKTETRVVPPLSTTIHSSLVYFLHELGKNMNESMFIVYSRDMKQLLKTRSSGGLYEKLENIQEIDHDIVVIDRRRGLFHIKVCYITEKKTGELSQSRLHLIQQKCDYAKSDFDHIKVLVREAGMQKNQTKSFPLPLPIVAFPRVRKEEIPPHNGLILSETECLSRTGFESWWKDYIIKSDSKKFALSPETHLALLAM